MSGIIKSINPSSYVQDRTADEITQAAKQRGLSLEPTDLSTLAGAYGAASLLRGEELEHHFINPSQTENPMMASSIQEVMQGLNWRDISGSGPIERAAAATALIQAKGGMDKMVNDKKNGKSLKDTLKELNDMAQAVREFGENDFAKQEFGDGTAGEQPELLLPKLSSMQMKILQALSVIGKLPKLPGAKRPTTLVRHPEGGIVRYREMRDYDELDQVDPVEMAMPDFLIRLADKQFMVPERWRKDFGKQIMALLIDHSGSMLSEEKQAYVRAMLLHLMNMVAKGHTTLFVAPFVTEMGMVTKIDSEEDAKAFYSKYKAGSGGTTDIEGVIKKAQADIANLQFGPYSLEFGCQPEIVIVNDGEDHIDPLTQLIAPTHALILAEHNADLRTVCENSGGSYYEMLRSPHQSKLESWKHSISAQQSYLANNPDDYILESS